MPSEEESRPGRGHTSGQALELAKAPSSVSGERGMEEAWPPLTRGLLWPAISQSSVGGFLALT